MEEYAKMKESESLKEIRSMLMICKISQEVKGCAISSKAYETAIKTVDIYLTPLKENSKQC